MTAKRLTDSLEPEPRSPRLMSEIAGDHESSAEKIIGPAAPILPRTRAPPIHKQNGPKSLITPSKKNPVTIPSESGFVDSIQLSVNANNPTMNIRPVQQSIEL